MAQGYLAASRSRPTSSPIILWLTLPPHWRSSDLRRGRRPPRHRVDAIDTFAVAPGMRPTRSGWRSALLHEQLDSALRTLRDC